MEVQEPPENHGTSAATRTLRWPGDETEEQHAGKGNSVCRTGGWGEPGMLEVLREHRATPWRGPAWLFTASQSPVYYRDMKYSCLMTHLGHTVSRSLVGGY